MINTCRSVSATSCRCSRLIKIGRNGNNIVNIKNTKFRENAFGPIRAVPPEEDGKIHITYARSSYS